MGAAPEMPIRMEMFDEARTVAASVFLQPSPSARVRQKDRMVRLYDMIGRRPSRTGVVCRSLDF